MKNIFITNDDGIRADGIVRLARAATAFGNVCVVAPDGQRSAMSHCITLHEPIDVFPVDFPVAGVRACATTGTPADCVRFGLANIMKGRADVVFSGINYGYNCGTDIQYSATVGAALEAAHMGVPAIAFSEGASDCHEVTDAYLMEMMERLIAQPLAQNQIWNVNFPSCALSDCKGILFDRTVADNAFYTDTYLEQPLPGGGVRLTVSGAYHENAKEGTDFGAIANRCVSVGIVRNVG